MAATKYAKSKEDYLEKFYPAITQLYWEVDIKELAWLYLLATTTTTTIRERERKRERERERESKRELLQ